ncbi:bifunctional precorrin-2 dehydrogenase/sirohydrochlorin ferrochelatase [Thermodesulfobacteriota bacterium]
METDHLYPVALKIAGKQCLVIGGGKVALRKVIGLLECAAIVTVVSPDVDSEIGELADSGAIVWRMQAYAADVLNGMHIVIVATSDHELNRSIAARCRKLGIMVNVVDVPELCDFFVPAVLRRQSLTVAVATDGKSPLLARILRQMLESIITEDYGDFLEQLGRHRDTIKRCLQDEDQRQKVFDELVSPEVLDLLKQGKGNCMKERIEQCISSLLV